jgi:hypothetical protein
VPDHDLRLLLEQSIRSNTQLLSRTGGLLKSAASAARNPGRLRGNDVRGLLGDWIKIEMDYLDTLSRNNTRYLNDVVSLAESVLAPGAPAPAPMNDATALTGTVGSVVAFRFQLDNPNDEAVAAAIEAEPWRGQAGGGVGADSIRFDPSTTVVPAGGNAMISGRIDIDDRFEAREIYETVIRVAGFPKQVRLRLAVVDPG